ncbi:DUF1993 family protein [Roseateles terrae]|uniref:DUF1993 domain-containing protein n=1 Tax=Roseateles terrae TaxID=431060 RepID=A0ABR6GXM9_9BURK|nr:DUF1993 family protein [Roseateles terrae]MBB3196865.1 hypothetical protein [Roseateles terrae]
MDTPIDALGTCTRLAALLGRADHLLARAEDGRPTEFGLDRRLAPDMFSLAEQVVVLADSLIGSAALLTGHSASTVREAAWVFNRGAAEGLGELPVTLAAARHRLLAAHSAVIDMARDSPRPASQRADAEVVVARPGHVRRFRLAAFVHDYALPNAYFHLTMIHALLRQAGVVIGKADYEGPRPYTLD